MSSMSYQHIVTVEPGKRGGRPCIRGMRIRVIDVLDMLGSGMTEAEILEQFPYLEREDLLASLQFASKRLDHVVVSA